MKLITQLASIAIVIGVVQANAQENDLAYSGNSSTCENAPCDRRPTPANITDDSRSNSYNDFLRVIWVPHGTSVTTITRGIRGLFSASLFFKPSVTVDEYVRFAGNFYREGQDFVEMRCIPTPEQRIVVTPFLATWPNTFPIIASDLGGPSHDCNSPLLTPGEKQICSLSSQYHEHPDSIYDNGLASALDLGSQLFGTQESISALSKDYGIFTAFTGLGFTVQASADVTGATVPMNSSEVLRNSIIPEYFLKNSALANANCRCLQVPENQHLHSASVSPSEIWERGELTGGACRMVAQLDEGDSTARLRK